MTEKLKVVFAPGVLEALAEEMTPVELQAFMDEIAAKIDAGTLFSDSTAIDMNQLKRDDPQLYERMIDQFDEAVVHPTIN